MLNIALLSCLRLFQAQDAAAPYTQKDAQALLSQIAQFNKENKDAKPADRTKKIEELLAAVPFERAELPALETLARTFSKSSKLAAAKDRLTALAKTDDAEGAAAEGMLAGLAMDAKDAAGIDAASAALLAHKGLDGALEKGRLTMFFSMLGRDDENLQRVAPNLIGIAKHFKDTTQFMPLQMGLDALVLACNAKTTSAADRNAVLDSLVHLCAIDVTNLEKKYKDDPKRLKGAKQYSEDTAAWLSGPAARGTLLGNAAPQTDLLWTNANQGWKSLADLKGKVVVIDFFATWCGPCIRAFPHIRELREHYADYDVTIIGITSIQGHHHPKGAKVVDTEGDPAREMELMKSFMSEYEMTWNVAFAKQSCFHPGFGVRGIPHVAILAPDGTVAVNGINPGVGVEKLEEKIDAALKAAGKRVPAAKAASQPADGSKSL